MSKKIKITANTSSIVDLTLDKSIIPYSSQNIKNRIKNNFYNFEKMDNLKINIDESQDFHFLTTPIILDVNDDDEIDGSVKPNNSAVMKSPKKQKFGISFENSLNRKRRRRKEFNDYFGFENFFEENEQKQIMKPDPLNHVDEMVRFSFHLLFIFFFFPQKLIFSFFFEELGKPDNMGSSHSK